MNKKIVFIICLSFFISTLLVQHVVAQQIQIVFLKPNVSNNMEKLNWGIAALKEWRRQPIEKVNNGLDGKFNLTVEILNISNNLIGKTPRLKICPMPNEPDKCWDQEVVTPINTKGVFNCNVYLRLSNWSKHIFKFKIGDEIVQVVIDEEKF
ncbi:hypothetical protein ACFL9T_08130 [Thermodesulfobacteriota bacterium]